ncbi:MAG: valine--tRNA ligase [Candidatus Woesearchaeota archaeon]
MVLPHIYDKKNEEKWQDYWVNEKLFQYDPNSKKPIFSIDTPPPTVSGAMHLGHAFSYSQADFIIRFQRMNGKNIFYPFGFDDNGLATERYVENKLKIRGNTLHRTDFINLCLQETQDIEKNLKNSWKLLGICPDWDINYRTIDEKSRRISQKSFIELYNQGREYRKEAPTIWCPECRTAIAQVELEDKEKDSFFNNIIFKLDDNKTDLIIATTRPELLPACVAVFVHPKDERYTSMVGKKVKVPLFNYFVPIISDDRVAIDKGTGVVMCCTFGDQVDVEWWKAYKLPLKICLTKDGKLNREGQKYEGLNIIEARKKIIQDLKDSHLLVNQKQIKHTLNVHERCGTAVEFLITKQWFIKYLDLKDEFLRLGDELKWYPEYMKNRYVNWIKGLQWDWCISRQRFFGVPFPVWYCKKCEKPLLADIEDLPVDPIHEKPKKKCSCGCSEFEPEKDVLDTWATSSLTPMIVTNWKEKNEKKEIKQFSLRPQAHDIISFWLFNTIVKCYFHKRKLPWEKTMISGWALDSKGKKMSKSKGNVIDPLEMIKKYSSDALRYWASTSKLGEDLWFKEKDFQNGQKLITKLWNASRLVLENIKDYKPKKPNNIEKIEKIDLWLLTKLQQVIIRSTDVFEKFDYSKAKQETENFFYIDFCDNYLEIVKDRFYNSEKYSVEQINSAKFTLFTAHYTIMKLFAPILPHITEEIYHSYYYDKHEKEKSIHLTKWPVVEPQFIDEKNKKKGDIVIDIIAAVRKFKSQNALSLKAELKELIIENKNPNIKDLIEDFKEVLIGTTKAISVNEGKGNIVVNPNLNIKIVK